jgi:hypothetical protein
MALDFLLALLIALLLTAVFSGRFRGYRYGAGILTLFVIVLLATWAGGVWIVPVGPQLWGASWLSFVFMGVFFALLLKAYLPPETEEDHRSRKVRIAEGETAAITAFNVFFWFLVLGLVLAILIRYV